MPTQYLSRIGHPRIIDDESYEVYEEGHEVIHVLVLVQQSTLQGVHGGQWVAVCHE